MRRLFYPIPIAGLLVLAALFFRDLNGSLPDARPSSLIGRPAPAIRLPPLDAAAAGFESADLNAGRVTVLNVWASWCLPCRAEAPALAAISRSGTAQLYGIVYEDKPAAAREYLKEIGNPFARLDLDADGRAGKAWKIYGVPETFIVDGNGIVRMRYAGPIVTKALTAAITRAIASAKRKS